MNNLIDSITSSTIVICIIIFSSAIIFGLISKRILINLSSKKKFENNYLLPPLIKSFGQTAILIFITLAVQISLSFLDFSESIEQNGTTISKALFTITFGIWIYYLVEIPSTWLQLHSGKKGNSTVEMLIPILRNVFRVIVIAIVLASLYKTISHKSITPFLASLGILGAAVALAAQDTFKNFFGSFLLISDKPFEVGERIVIDGFDGIVQNTGIRSTRIKTLDDHLVTIPNGILANKTIQNIGKRNCIKRSFTISITYNTPPNKVSLAKSILESILENHEGMNDEFPPRVYFKDFAASSLDIMIIYWYFPPNYWDYLAFSEKVNLEIIERFNAEDIEFAFPTQSLYINNN